MKRPVALAVMALLSLAPALSAAAIQHAPISCVPAERNHAKVVTAVPDATSVRVYFRAQQFKEEYYVEMLKDAAGNWWAPLPVPDAATSSVVYRLVAHTPAGEVASVNYAVPVAASCAPFPLDAEELAISHNMVVGFVEEGKEIKGFRCVDVANRVTPNGEMRRYDECKAGGALTPLQNAAIAAGATAVGVIGVINVDDPPEETIPVSLVRP
jgi:hypothetical protein